MAAVGRLGCLLGLMSSRVPYENAACCKPFLKRDWVFFSVRLVWLWVHHLQPQKKPCGWFFFGFVFPCNQKKTIRPVFFLVLLVFTKVFVSTSFIPSSTSLQAAGGSLGDLWAFASFLVLRRGAGNPKFCGGLSAPPAGGSSLVLG